MTGCYKERDERECVWGWGWVGWGGRGSLAGGRGVYWCGAAQGPVTVHQKRKQEGQ